MASSTRRVASRGTCRFHSLKITPSPHAGEGLGERGDSSRVVFSPSPCPSPARGEGTHGEALISHLTN
jgi:hypothetical protein